MVFAASLILAIALVAAILALLKPGPRVALAAAGIVVVLEVAAGALLSGAGGIECPRGCRTDQSIYSYAFFLVLPAAFLALVGRAAYGVITARRRGESSLR
jgi:hypothetical protein